MTTINDGEAGMMKGYDVRVYVRGVMVANWHVETIETAADIVENLKEKAKLPSIHHDLIQVIKWCKGEPYKDKRYDYMVTEVWRETETYVKCGDQWDSHLSSDLLPDGPRLTLRERP